MSSDFEIRNLEELDTSAANLAQYNQQLYSCANSLEHIISKINANWENDKGTDCQSAVDALTKIVSRINDEIGPILKKYIDTLNVIVTETQLTQSKSL